MWTLLMRTLVWPDNLTNKSVVDWCEHLFLFRKWMIKIAKKPFKLSWLLHFFIFVNWRRFCASTFLKLWITIKTQYVINRFWNDFSSNCFSFPFWRIFLEFNVFLWENIAFLNTHSNCKINWTINLGLVLYISAVPKLLLTV